MPADLATKYADQLRDLALDLGEYARTYSQAIRIDPTRFLGWTGRSRLPGASAA